MTEAPPLSALGELVRKGDPDRFEAALFAEERLRERLFTLYAFNLEAARAPWRVSEPQIGAMRLRFLLDILERAYAGQSPLAHEVGAPLHALIRETDPPRALLEALVEARMRDLEPEPMPDRAAFDAYVADTAGALMRLAAGQCLAAAGVSDAASREAVDAIAADLGYAHGVAALLEATPALAAHGHVALPGAESAPLRLSDLSEGVTPADWRRAANAVAAEGLARLKRARARRGSMARPAIPAFLAAWRAERLLRIAARPDLDLLRDLGPESPFRRRAGLLWRGFTGRW